jgi:hypothetical protein
LPGHNCMDFLTLSFVDNFPDGIHKSPLRLGSAHCVPTIHSNRMSFMHPQNYETHRPGGVTALSVFFAAGALISFLSFASLLFPGSFLEPMWRLNPRAKDAFAGMGRWSIVLMGAVCLACSFSASGLWRGKIWGHRLAFSVLAINLLGDIANVIFGLERRAAIGVPIALAMLLYMRSRRIRDYFKVG